ncbi:hypothetical protein BGZ92_006561, partial [Podila epicladia]
MSAPFVVTCFALDPPGPPCSAPPGHPPPAPVVLKVKDIVAEDPDYHPYLIIT